MMEEKYLLLLDALKLRASYSNQAFEDIIKVLQEGDRDPTLAKYLQIIKELQLNGGNEQRKIAHKKSSDGSILEAKLDNLRDNEPSKYKFISELKSKTMSVSNKDLKNFLSDRIPGKMRSKITKVEMVNQYLLHIMHYSIPELESELTYFRENFEKTDEGLNAFMGMAERIINPIERNK